MIGPAATPACSVEAGHRRKAGADVSRRVRGVALKPGSQNKMEVSVSRMKLKNAERFIKATV